MEVLAPVPKVLVIDTGWAGDAQIRMLEGQYEGKAFWTDIEWMMKDNGTIAQVPPPDRSDSTSSKQPNSTPGNQRTLDEQLFSLLDKIISTEIGEKEDPANISAALALINQGANVDAGKGLGDTPLIRAARNGHIQVMKILLDKGADINAQDDTGMTALMWAAHMGDPEMTRLLIAKGAKLNIKDDTGFTALSGAEGATDNRHLAAIRLLRKAGAK